MSKVLIIVGDATETVDTLYPYYRLQEDGFVPVVAAPEKRRYQMVLHEVKRSDIHALAIPGSSIAADMGSPKLLNMIMLGALLEVAPVLPLAAIERALDAHLSANHRGLLELNKLALRRGMELAHAERELIS